jgi:hypothetical protein
VTKAVLVIGGTGGFGRRLVHGLAATSDFDIVIAGRDLPRAERLARTIDASGTRVRAVRLDRSIVTAAELRAAGAIAVVDAAGPFQGADYRLARAAIEAGMHYVDLADARDFVGGFGGLDSPARDAGVALVTGASSSPGLSTAVLDALTRGWRRVDRIEIAIAPGNKVGPRGLSVLRSVLSYCGKPVRVFDVGRWRTRPGWGMTARRDVPGLGRRWLSLCETPDLDIAVRRYAVRDAVVFRAGLELAAMHLGLLLISLPVRARIVPSLAPFAAGLGRAAGLLQGFGSDRGGMIVEARGADAEDVAVRARWTLVAEAGDGPTVPSLPALAVLRALSQDRVRPGAHICADVIDLADIEREFRPYQIRVRRCAEQAPSPFRRILGSGLDRLPEPVRRLHSLSTRCDVAGLAEITVARGLLPWLMCKLAGLPASGSAVPVTVSFQPDGEGREYWRRRFARRRYASTMRPGVGAAAGLLVERLLPFEFRFRLTPADDGLDWLLVGWRLLFLPLPAWSLPKIRCRETGDGPRFVFDIDVRFPVIGPVIHYRGWLLPEDVAAGDQASAM